MIAVDPLRVENTVPLSEVRHRLALGLQWVDALSQASAIGDWVTDLEAIGARPCSLRFERHREGRASLRFVGRLARLLTRAAEEKTNTPPADAESDPTNALLRGHAAGNDPRCYVPRRLSLTPLLSAGQPAAGTANIRSAWLWPGCCYPLAAQATALRGRVRRGLSAQPVAWARIVVTRPRPAPAPADFASERQLGWAHGDDRGEFLAVLDAAALPGGVVLPQAITLRVWVFLPPADAFDPADPLASLPLEVAGTDPLNDLLRGTLPPAAYLRMNPIDVTLAPGEIASLDEALLLFA